MTLKTLAKICMAAVVIVLVLFGVLSIRVSLYKQLLLVALILPFTYLCVYLIFWHGEKFLSLFEWMTRPRIAPPAFSCVRCQSLRVIIHERREEGFLHRYFWCKDCSYEWSNIDPNPQTDVKSAKA